MIDLLPAFNYFPLKLVFHDTVPDKFCQIIMIYIIPDLNTLYIYIILQVFTYKITREGISYIFEVNILILYVTARNNASLYNNSFYRDKVLQNFMNI